MDESVEYITEVSENNDFIVPTKHNKIRYIKLELGHFDNDDKLTIEYVGNNGTKHQRTYSKQKLCSINAFLHFEFSLEDAESNNTQLYIVFCVDVNYVGNGYIGVNDNIKFTITSDKIFTGNVKCTINYEI